MAEKTIAERTLDLWSRYQLHVFTADSLASWNPAYVQGELDAAAWLLQTAVNEGLPDLRTWKPESTIPLDDVFVF